jgi:hypothetical protein
MIVTSHALEQKGDPNRICRGNDPSRLRKKTEARASSLHHIPAGHGYGKFDEQLLGFRSPGSLAMRKHYSPSRQFFEQMRGRDAGC